MLPIATALVRASLGQLYEGGMTVMAGYDLSWAIDSETITVTIMAQTTSWVGFGFSENGGMFGADVMIASVDDVTGEATIGDYWVGGFNGMPILDEDRTVADGSVLGSQDWTLVEASQSDGVTTVTASRARVSGDPQDWPLEDFAGAPTKVIAAYGVSDALSYHGPGSRVTSSAYFFGGSDPMEAIRADTELETFDLNAQGFEIPQFCDFEDGEAPANVDSCGWTTDTTYASFCLSFGADTPDQHIVAIEALIDQAQYVHHYVVTGYQCEGCEECSYESEWIWAWAPGQEPLVWPAEAGARFGGTTGYRSMRLEIHYDNPAFVAGVVDYSGLRAYTTTALRPYDSGVLQTADPWQGLASVELPLGLSRWDFECGGATTEQALAYYLDRQGGYASTGGEVTVFAHFHHAHQTATKMKTVLTPPDGEAWAMTSNYYDFNHQGNRHQDVPAGPWKLKAGTSIQVSCWYDTKETPTRFQLGSADEMCIDYMFVYPRPVETVCSLGDFGEFHGGAVPLHAAESASETLLARRYLAEWSPEEADCVEATPGWSHPLIGGCDAFSVATCETHGRDDHGAGTAADNCCACRGMALTCADYEGALHSVGGADDDGGGSCTCHGGEAGVFSLDDIPFHFPESGCYDEDPLLSDDGQMLIFQVAVALDPAVYDTAEALCPNGTFFSVAVTYEIGCNEAGVGKIGDFCESDEVDDPCSRLLDLYSGDFSDCSQPLPGFGEVSEGGVWNFLNPDAATIAGMCPTSCGCCDGGCSLSLCPDGCVADSRHRRRHARRLLFGSFPPVACPAGCVPA